MLNVVDLSKVYDSFSVLNSINFSINVGELVALVGKNGAGKSTCLKILSTCMLPTSGKLELFGFDYSSHKTHVSNLLGYVPDNPALYGNLTVSEYLKFIGQLKGINTKNLSTAFNKVIEQCQLTNVTQVLCKNLSRGYKQRVNFAQALINEPRLLILDEPTIGLDQEQLVILRTILQNRAKESIVIFSSHLLSDALDLCSRVIVFNKGQITDDLNLNSKLIGINELKEKLMAA